MRVPGQVQAPILEAIFCFPASCHIIFRTCHISPIVSVFPFGYSLNLSHLASGLSISLPEREK